MEHQEKLPTLPIHGRLPELPERAYKWGRDELCRRDREIGRCGSYADLQALQRAWAERERAFGITKAARKRVLAAAIEERGEQPWRAQG